MDGSRLIGIFLSVPSLYNKSEKRAPGQAAPMYWAHPGLEGPENQQQLPPSFPRRSWGVGIATGQWAMGITTGPGAWTN